MSLKGGLIRYMGQDFYMAIKQRFERNFAEVSLIRLLIKI